MTMLARIAELVFNRPLLLPPEKMSVVLAALEGRFGGLDLSGIRPEPETSRFVGGRRDPASGNPLAYRRTPEGVAIISLVGSFVNRGAWIEASSGLISYEGLAFQLQQVAVDPQVRAVVLDLESPGGQATGAFESAQAVRDLAAKKPVTAVVNGLAASAAYAIASGATRIVTTPTGLSGSIGVVLCHLDRSAALEKAGIKPTLIHAGAHKVDANPYEALSADVRADLQAECEALLTMFVDTVTAGRKNLSAKAVRATEARVFMGADAVKAGLADAVGSFESALAEATRTAPGRPSSSRTPTGASLRSTTVDETEEKQARAEERARVKSIVTCDEAKDRGPQALMIATETELGLDAARAILAASPKQSKYLSLDERRAHRTELNLDPDGPPGAEREARRAETAKALDPSSIYATRRAARGDTA